MSAGDGMNYAPSGPGRPVIQAGEFTIAATHLDHGHIFGMVNGLTEAGATLKWVYDPDQAKVDAMKEKFPDVQVARSFAEVLEDPEVGLVASAAIPSQRCDVGLQAMAAGKDYFTDKAPMTTLAQLDSARAAVEETARKYAVYYSERLHVECAVHAGELVHGGAIGRVIQVLGTGPHRLSAPSRPDWFFDKESYGGILCDIGSHQIEQFLYYSGATDAKVLSARVANFNHPDRPGLEDFGEANLAADNGASNYLRVDWFTPDGLPTWGDGRTFILGTEGYIELRKYTDIARSEAGNQLYLVNGDGVQHLELTGQVGYPFFGELILDCLNRTEIAMTQEHAFKAAELCLKAQAMADAEVS